MLGRPRRPPPTPTRHRHAGRRGLILGLVLTVGLALLGLERATRPGGDYRGAKEASAAPMEALTSPVVALQEPTGGLRRPVPLAAYAVPILGRNLFDSSPPDPGPPEPTSELVESELPLQLIATSVASDPRWSSAIVTPEKKAPTRIVWPGSYIGQALVQAIKAPWLDAAGVHHPARLILLHAGQRAYVDEANPAPKIRKKPIRKNKKKRKKRKRRRRRNKGR